MTGIGGQGVQLIAATLGSAAAASDLEVLVFGQFGGAMRGGPSSATVVIGDETLNTPPDVDSAWAAVALHHEGWSLVRSRLRANGVVVVDTSVFHGDPNVECSVVGVAASEIATGLGFAGAASMVALGAFAAITRIVSLDALQSAVAELLPSYRARHIAVNHAALMCGWDVVTDERRVPAWGTTAVGAR